MNATTINLQQPRIALRPRDWEDPTALRERLAEIHTHDFISPRTVRIEHAIVVTLKRLTRLDADTIRANAREDAAAIIAAEPDAGPKTPQ